MRKLKYRRELALICVMCAGVLVTLMLRGGGGATVGETTRIAAIHVTPVKLKLVAGGP